MAKIVVSAPTLPEAWENVLVSLWKEGDRYYTEYDKKDDPKSKDAFTVMEVTKPLSEPRIHLCFPGGPLDLKSYELEVTQGIHDRWVVNSGTGWNYTYHSRLTNYKGVDQLDAVARKLSETPHTRRAVAITWNPVDDLDSTTPPCLQQLWFRMEECEEHYKLHMNTLWRSRDWYKAAFMNAWAFIALQKQVADTVYSKRKDGGYMPDKPVIVGTYTDVCWSSHIYGSYFSEDGPTSVQGVIDSFGKRSFLSRTANSTESPWPEMFAESIETVWRVK